MCVCMRHVLVHVCVCLPCMYVCLYMYVCLLYMYVCVCTCVYLLCVCVCDAVSAGFPHCPVLKTVSQHSGSKQSPDSKKGTLWFIGYFLWVKRKLQNQGSYSLEVKCLFLSLWQAFPQSTISGENVSSQKNLNILNQLLNMIFVITGMVLFYIIKARYFKMRFSIPWAAQNAEVFK